MRRQVVSIEDIDATSTEWAEAKAKAEGKIPQVLTLSQLQSLEVPTIGALIERFEPSCGAALNVATQKAGKTLLAVQELRSVATGADFLDHFKVLRQGPVAIVEQDDPAGAASIRDILNRSGVPSDAPIYFIPRLPFSLGQEFIDWARKMIQELGLVLLVLDSYTALRPAHSGKCDIVKVEHAEMTMLDELGKQTNCLIKLVHHESKGSAGLDWSSKAGGTYAMTMATESLVSMSRFDELPIAAPERLVRIRGRHLSELEMVIRFRKDTLDFEFVMEGGASASYPTIQQIRGEFHSNAFGPKELCMATGMSRASAHRHLGALVYSGILIKPKFGEYRLTEEWR